MSVVHVCGYENEPEQVDADSLREELATDETFGMIGDEDYQINCVCREEDPELFETLGIPEDSDDINNLLIEEE